MILSDFTFHKKTASERLKRKIMSSKIICTFFIFLKKSQCASMISKSKVTKVFLEISQSEVCWGTVLLLFSMDKMHLAYVCFGLYQHIYSPALNTAVKQWVKEEGCVVVRAFLHFLTQSTCLHWALLTGNHSSISHLFFPMLVRLFLGMSGRCSLLKKQQRKKERKQQKVFKNPIQENARIDFHLVPQWSFLTQVKGGDI